MNRENAIDGLYAQHPGALVVVGQVRDIGPLALSRARLAGMPRAYLPGLAAQRDFLACENTRSKNRLRSILLESCPEFEARAGLSDPAALKLMAAVGGPWSISEASPQAVGALTRGCRRAKVAALAESVGSSVSASPQGNKRLKNLLAFSCNCVARSRNRRGGYYARCRDGGMPHGKALKAVARKRLKVIYAVMRDRAPYST